MGDLFAPSHIILVVVVALLLFGPKKLPELGRGVGRMLREFKDSAKGIVTDEDADNQTKKIVDNNDHNK